MTHRTYGRTVMDKSFNEATVEAVWRKGKIISKIDPAKSRRDACGALIDRDQYGVTVENGTGWEVDHIKPVSRGGSDDLSNLQPLQWQNNRAKSDNLPGQWECAAVSGK